MFEPYVKGRHSGYITVSGTITAVADGTASKQHYSVIFSLNLLVHATAATSDFERLSPLRFTNYASFSLHIVNDNVTLEYDDRVQLKLSPDDPLRISSLESKGHYVRRNATIYINDTDCKF